MDRTLANKVRPVTAAKKQIDGKSEARNSPVADLKKKNLDTDKSRKAGPPTNPLLIHIILDKVLSFAKKKDLRSCRRVCRMWNLRLIPRFRQEFEVFLCTIRHPKTLPLHAKEFEDGCKLVGKDRGLWTFLELMQTSICIPFGKYRLDLNSKGNSRNQFFKICGPEMTHVTLENWTLEQEFDRHLVLDSGKDDLCFIIENLNEMFKYTTKLESINFDTPIIMSKSSKSKTVNRLKAKPILPALKKILFKGFQGPRGNIPAFFEDFFARTPNIVDACLTRQLEWHDWDNNLSIWPETIRSMYSAIASTGRMSTIENLAIDTVFPNEFVDQMQKDGTKLKKLCVKCLANEMPVPHIFEYFKPHRLIELQKDSLRSLTYELRGIGRRSVEFRKMKNLKVLHIHFTHYIQILCTNLSFTETFPNLEILTYFSGRNGQTDLSFLGVDPCPKLKSIDLLFYELDITKFEMMTQVYSSSALTTLKLDTGYFTYPKLLELIFSNLTNLRVLGLRFTHRDLNLSLDSMFTGISIEECMKIRNTPTFWNFMKGKNKGKKLSELARLHVSPSIADMKSLTRLCLKFPGRGLTNITGYLGLYELVRLRDIHIDFCEFTTTCCEALKKELNLQSWVFRQKKGTIVPEYNIPHLGPFGEGANQERTMDILPPYIYPYEETEQHPIFW